MSVSYPKTIYFSRCRKNYSRSRCLLLSDPVGYAASSKFLVKMTVVGVILVNGLLLNFYISPRLTKLRFRTHEDRKADEWFKRIAFVSGVVSISSWYASFLLGLLSSIPLTYWQGMGVYLIILSVGGVISQFAYHQFLRISARMSKNIEK
jgi:hypothetical protein